MAGGCPPPEEWTYRSMGEGRRFETWYQEHLEDVVPWHGVREGDRVVMALARAILFKEGEKVRACIVFDVAPGGKEPRRWYDSEAGTYRPMEHLKAALRTKIDRFLAGKG